MMQAHTPARTAVTLQPTDMQVQVADGTLCFIFIILVEALQGISAPGALDTCDAQPEHRLVLTSRRCLSSSSGCRLTTHVHVCVYIWRLVRIVRHACVELVHNVMEEQRTYTTAGCCIMCTVKACKGSLPVDQSLQRHCLSSAITRCKSCFAQKQVSGLSSVSATWTSTANGYWCAFYLHRAA